MRTKCTLTLRVLYERLWNQVQILIDECLPRELGDELIGHEVTTVQEKGSPISRRPLLRIVVM